MEGVLTMKQYRGYYIDGICFNSEAEIDAHIKVQNIKRMNRFNRMMREAKTSARMMAASIEADKAARYLHDYCGMSWAEIEAAEIEGMRTA